MTKPSVADIEINLLGAYIDNEDLFSKCEHLVSEKLWGSKVNRIAYNLIREMRSQSIKPDLILLTKELKKKGVPDKSIPTYHVSHANYKFQPEQYVIQLFEENIKRYLSPELHSAYNDFDSGKRSPLEIMETLKGKINDIDLVLNNVSQDKGINNIVASAISEIEEMMTMKGRSGYTTTITRLDEITGGFLPGIWVLASLPGMGKTSFIVNIIKANAIDRKLPFVFFSGEMSATQIVKNIYCNVFEINTAAMRDGSLDDDEIKNIKSFKIPETLIIDDKAGITWQYVDTKLTRIRKKIPMDVMILVAIDYIQIMSGTDDEGQISNTCKGLMNIWKKHNCCIIELSQLGREVAKEKRRPRMSDGKGSGAIEANANVYALLHRPDYFEEMPTDNFGRDLRGKVEIIVDKNRVGRKGYAYCDFYGKYSKFKDIDKNEWEKQKSGGGIL